MISMIKEYEDIKFEVAKSHPEESDELIIDRANSMFKSIFGLDVKEAELIYMNNQWDNYLKKESSINMLKNNNEFKSFFSAGEIECKSIEDDFYVSGFISAPSPDVSNDYLEQEKLLEKLIDLKNPMSKNLSYGHGWTKGDSNDTDVLGVLKNAELREHPVLKKPAVWAEYKLMKTHPYYNKTIYNIKENALKGFSIEFNEAKRNFVKFGNTVVKKLEDYFLAGVALVGRPNQINATLTGYVVKEFVFDDGGRKDMEVKEEVTQSKEVSKVDEKPIEKPSNNEVEELRKELEFLKAQKAEETRQAEINALKKELDSLKAEKRVLVDKTEQNFTNQEPIKNQANDYNDKIKEIQESKKLTTEEKLRRLAEMDLQ